MLRAEKQGIVEDLHGVFTAAGVVVVTHYKGMSVAELGTLRRQMREAGAAFRVTKNSLAKRAVANTDFAAIEPMLEGPTAIAYSHDPVAAPKAITAFAKKNDKLKIIGGGLQNTLLGVEQVNALAEMPPIEEVRAKLLGVIVAPAARLVGILNAPARDLVGLMGAPGAKLARVLQAKSQAG